MCFVIYSTLMQVKFLRRVALVLRCGRTELSRNQVLQKRGLALYHRTDHLQLLCPLLSGIFPSSSPPPSLLSSVPPRRLLVPGDVADPDRMYLPTAWAFVNFHF